MTKADRKALMVLVAETAKQLDKAMWTIDELWSKLRDVSIEKKKRKG